MITGFLAESGVFLRELELKLTRARERAVRGMEFACADWREMTDDAHNIKRMAAYVGLAATQNLAHELEKVLCLVCEGGIIFDARTREALTDAVAALRALFAGLNKTAKEDADVHAIMARLKEIQTAAPGSAFVCGPRVVLSAEPDEKNGGVCRLPAKNGEMNAQSDLTKPTARCFGFD